MSADTQQRWGDNVDRGRTIERVAAERWPLDRTGQSDQTAWWHDAITRAPIMPRRGFGTIAPETPVEIKGCQWWTHDHDRRGRWLIREHCHEQLLANDGEYLLVVYRDRDGSDGGDGGGRGPGDPHRALGARLAARLADRDLVSDLGTRQGRASYADSLEPCVRLRRLRGHREDSCMSSNTDTESDTNDERTETEAYLPDDGDEIRERLLDLEIEVFGYNPREDRQARDANRKVKRVIAFLENEREDDAAPASEVFTVASVVGLDTEETKQAIESLRKFGEIYNVGADQLRVTA